MNEPLRLYINIDHVATVREARSDRRALPVRGWAAVLAELGGADGITVHLREDRRFISRKGTYACCWRLSGPASTWSWRRRRAGFASPRTGVPHCR